MSADLHTHRTGVLRALFAQMNLINASIGHSLTYGEQNEETLRKLLRSALPAAYGVGSGIIVGTDGTPSKQIDIIVYDQTGVNLTLSDQTHLFFADQVLMTIEVKTHFNAKNLKEGLEAIASVKRLKMAPHKWYELYFDTRSMQPSVKVHGPVPPTAVIFFFKGYDPVGPVDIVSHHRMVRDAVEKVSLLEQPDLLYSHHHASWFKHPDIGLHSDKPQQLTSLVHSSAGKPISLGWDASKLKFTVDFAGFGLREDQDLMFVKLVNSQCTSEIVMEALQEQFLEDPVIYRVARCGQDYHYLDRERSFLNCIEAIGVMLKERPPNPNWRAADYFGEEYGHFVDYARLVSREFGPDEGASKEDSATEN